MPLQKENTRPAANEQVQEDVINNTSLFDNRDCEQAILRGLLGAPASKIQELAATLEDKDFSSPHRLTVYRAIVEAARRLSDAGQPRATVPPERVQLDLQQAGKLNTPGVSRALLDATAGNYPPPMWQDMQDLATGLRQARLRRALHTFGAELTEASQGGVEDLHRCLTYVPYLLTVARRAGLEVT